jgi:hypothetical protein
MSRHYGMKSPQVRVEFVGMEVASAKGGVFALKRFADEFQLWERVDREPALDPRRHRRKGFDPRVMVAMVLFGFCTGGASMADFERLNDEAGLKKFLGVKKFPDQTTLAQWLRAVGREGAAAVWRLTREFLAWVLPQVDPGRYLHAGQLELFFDDTQLELHGKCFEGAKVNYEGNLTLSWQTTWVGPFLAAGELGEGSRDCSGCLPGQLEACASLLDGYETYLYADSGSSAGKYLDALGVSVNHYSVSYNKWTEGALDAAAAALPEAAWSAEQTLRWRDGKLHRAQHAWLRYQPSGCNRPQQFAVTRHQLEGGELFWRYAFIACESGREGTTALAIERHQLKGDKERMFGGVLSDFDLHHPPCQDLAANEVFYALGALAHNLLIAIKLIYLPEHQQPARIRTLQQRLMLIPVQFKRHARQLKAVCSVATDWLPWWQSFAQQLHLRPAPT